MSGYDDCQNQLGQGHRHSQDGLGQNISNQGGLGQPQPGAQGKNISFSLWNDPLRIQSEFY